MLGVDVIDVVGSVAATDPESVDVVGSVVGVGGVNVVSDVAVGSDVVTDPESVDVGLVDPVSVGGVVTVPDPVVVVGSVGVLTPVPVVGLSTVPDPVIVVGS